MGRLCALAIVLGAALVQCLDALPSLRYLYMSGVALCLCCGLSGLMSWYLCGESGKQRQSLVWVSKTLAVVLVFLLSSTWATWRAEQRLNEAIALEHENVVTRLTFQVASLPSDTTESIRFEAQVLAPCPPGVPRRLQVAWLKSPSTARILPGQIWRAALVLRRPHGNLNPQGFDYEGHLFAKNIRALARVRGAPQLLADEPYSSFGVAVARVRHVVREAMRRTTQTMTYGAVLIALAIGDQDSVEQKHWKVFNLTGITHLVSISGSHVTMIAALGAWVAVWCVKRFRWRGRAVCERLPASVAAASVALLVAWAYCLLAGWGIPAQRTFFMLAVAALALVSRYALSASRVLALAAAVVVLVDPWSPLATGFWLSFLAVAILFAAGVATIKPRHSQAGWQRFLLLLKEASRLQGLITLAMLPVLAFLFQQVSLVSPFANALAIPVLTFIVTPLALGLALFGVVPGLEWLASASGWLGHLALQSTLIPVTWLAELPWAAFDVAAAPLWTLGLAACGLCWALQPPGWPARWLGWCLLLPVLSAQPERPAEGHWRLLVFDVGQGAAALLQTKRHDLLFDTGPPQGTSDAGTRLLVPALRALGVQKLDALVTSHSDSDHAGGLLSVLQAIPVTVSYASFDLEEWLSRLTRVTRGGTQVRRAAQVLRCHQGQQWQWDGVVLSFKHPSQTTEPTRRVRPRQNAQSCVLHLSGARHSALLPGDIGVNEERLLLRPSVGVAHLAAANSDLMKGLAKNDLRADVVLVAHHGSNTSSALEWIEATQAQHAIAQTGYLNRFAHPHPEIKQRWITAGARFWQTDQHGAVLFESRSQGLRAQAYSQLRQRYWHHRAKVPAPQPSRREVLSVGRSD